MLLRDATEADAAALAAVYRSAYQENRELGFPAKAEHATADDVRSWIRDHRVFVAVDPDADAVEDTSRAGGQDGAVVGGVRVEAVDEDAAKFSRLGVREDRKGEGIGSALVDHVEAFARDAGYDAVRLTTPEDHPYLPGFYRARGYERVGEYPLEYRDYDEVVLEKQLGK